MSQSARKFIITRGVRCGPNEYLVGQEVDPSHPDMEHIAKFGEYQIDASAASTDEAVDPSTAFRAELEQLTKKQIQARLEELGITDFEKNANKDELLAILIKASGGASTGEAVA